MTNDNRLNHFDIYSWNGNNFTVVERIPTDKTVAYSTMQDSDELIAIDLVKQEIRWRIKTSPHAGQLSSTRLTTRRCWSA